MRIRHIFHTMQDLEQRLSQRLCRRLKRLMRRLKQRWRDVADADLLRALSIAAAFVAMVEEGDRMQAMDFDHMLHGQSIERLEMEGRIIALNDDDIPLETMVWDSICLMLEEHDEFTRTAQYAFDLADRHEVYAYSDEVIDDPPEVTSPSPVSQTASSPVTQTASISSGHITYNISINFIINPIQNNMPHITNNNCSFNAINTQGGNVHISHDTYCQSPQTPHTESSANEAPNAAPSDTDDTPAPAPSVAPAETMDEELCFFIHPAVDDDATRLKIHREIQNIVTSFSVPEICDHLYQMAKSGRILMPEAGKALKELQRLGMPGVENKGFSKKNFENYYKKMRQYGTSQDVTR